MAETSVMMGEVGRVPGVVRPWRAGLAAARANRWPGLVLSLFAVGLLLAYWYVPAVHGGLERLGQLRQGLSLPMQLGFAAVSTAMFGGIIPGLVQRARPRLRATMPWRHLWFLAGVWAVKGVEVDLLYRVQAMWFGNDAALSTIVPKIAFDMGLYCPIWAVPTTVLAYAYKDADFIGRRMVSPWRRRESGGRGFRGWYMGRALPVVISNWAVWVPAVCVIYCLPLALQLPMQNLVLCFWSLLLVLQVREGEAEGMQPLNEQPCN